jgi:hypothetical protein
VSVPGADELFRPTGVPQQGTDPEAATGPAAPAGPDGPVDEAASGPGGRTPSGRVRHDEKMTVYVTGEELLDLEHARLVLRRLGITVDRGRLVRTAVAIALADLEANGPDSLLADRLTQA